MSEETTASNESTTRPEPLDTARWEKLEALQQATGRNFLGEVIDLFLNDTPDRIHGLREAVAQGEAAQAERMAHSVKGSSSNIGASHMEAIAAELERRMARSFFDGTDDLLARLEAESERVRAALEALRPS